MCVCGRESKTKQSNSPIPDTVCGHRQQHNVCYCNLPCPGWMDLHHFEAETLDICKYKDEVSLETSLDQKR